MERNVDVQGAWSRMVTQWQPAVLVTACLAGGLTLTTMVIGSTPDVLVQATETAIEAEPDAATASAAPIVSEEPVDTEGSAEVAEVVDAVVADAATVPASAAAAVSPEPAAATPTPAPTAAPAAATPSAPAPVPVGTPAPTPVTVAAPRSTSPPTTTPSPPTTAAPPPTTAAPAAATLTYPSFSAGPAATVVFQFDGSSIYVASVTRQPNWVYEIEKNGPRTVEIKFFNTATGQDEEFHATVEGGRIKVEN